MSLQIIARDGKPEWAVLPYEEYLRLVEQAEMLLDIRDYDQARAAVAEGTEEVFPAALADALLSGEHPVKIWREYRRLTQQQVAAAAGISVPYLSQIERGRRKAATAVMKRLAQALGVQVDDLV